MEQVVEIYDKERNPIIVINQEVGEISGVELHEKIKKFVNKAKPKLENLVDFHIRVILDNLGIKLYNDDKESIQRAFAELWYKYALKVGIEDIYRKNENIVWQKDLISVIYEDGVLSLANGIKVGIA